MGSCWQQAALFVLFLPSYMDGELQRSALVSSCPRRLAVHSAGRKLFRCAVIFLNCAVPHCFSCPPYAYGQTEYLPYFCRLGAYRSAHLKDYFARQPFRYWHLYCCRNENPARQTFRPCRPFRQFPQFCSVPWVLPPTVLPSVLPVWKRGFDRFPKRGLFRCFVLLGKPYGSALPAVCSVPYSVRLRP